MEAHRVDRDFIPGLHFVVLRLGPLFIRIVIEELLDDVIEVRVLLNLGH